MKDANSGRSPADAFHVVDDPRQARLLTDDDVLRFFRPFLARDASASEAAAEVGVSLDRMLYRIRTFLDAGLLRVVRHRPRAGRAVKIYRSRHDAYFVPYAATPFATLQELLRQHFEATAHHLADALAAHEVARDRPWDGYRLYRTEDGETWVVGSDVALDETEAVDLVTTLHLREDDARALRHALVDLFRAYARRSHDGTGPGAASDVPSDEPSDDDVAPYLLQFVLVPGDAST